MNNEKVKCATRGEGVKWFTHFHPFTHFHLSPAGVFVRQASTNAFILFSAFLSASRSTQYEMRT
jgi:hypothetical protein